MGDIETRLEATIMESAKQTEVRIRLAFLIELQRHCLHLTSLLATAEEAVEAQQHELRELVNQAKAGQVNEDQLVDRLVEISGWSVEDR